MVFPPTLLVSRCAVWRADGSSAQRQFRRPHFLAVFARDPEMEMEHSPSCFVRARIRCSMTLRDKLFMSISIYTYQHSSRKSEPEKEKHGGVFTVVRGRARNQPEEFSGSSALPAIGPLSGELRDALLLRSDGPEITGAWFCR